MKIDKEIDNDECREALRLAATKPALWSVPSPITMGALLWHDLIEIRVGDVIHLTKKGEELLKEWFPLTTFSCGPPTDHVCDHDGPEEVLRSEGGRVLGSSSTCSKCGSSSFDRSYWSDA